MVSYMNVVYIFIYYVYNTNIYVSTISYMKLLDYMYTYIHIHEIAPEAT